MKNFEEAIKIAIEKLRNWWLGKCPLDKGQLYKIIYNYRKGRRCKICGRIYESYE